MSDLNLVVLAVVVGIAAGIPVLLLFRSSGRRKCWRCRVWMLPVRLRMRTVPLLPIGNCEGCHVWCLALGQRKQKNK